MRFRRSVVQGVLRSGRIGVIRHGRERSKEGDEQVIVKLIQIHPRLMAVQCPDLIAPFTFVESVLLTSIKQKPSLSSLFFMLTFYYSLSMVMNQLLVCYFETRTSYQNTCSCVE